MSSTWYDKKDARGHRVCHYLFDHWCMKCGCREKEKMVYSLCEVSDEEYLVEYAKKNSDNPFIDSHIEQHRRMFLDKDPSTKTRFYSDFSKKYQRAVRTETDTVV